MSRDESDDDKIPTTRQGPRDISGPSDKGHQDPLSRQDPLVKQHLGAAAWCPEHHSSGTGRGQGNVAGAEHSSEQL